MSQIYLDYNASTPISRPVADLMHELIDAGYGNPSSAHWAGRPARGIIEHAREQVAEMLGCESDEIIFTSGGSEANNLAIKGSFFARRDETRNHIITSSIEHPATLAPCRFLERFGARITLLPVDGTGRVDPDDVAAAMTPETLLITIMHANNEVGTIQPIAEIARIAHDRGVLLHADAAQSVGKIDTRVDALGVDLLSIAGHKLYAPKGIGALYRRRGTALESLIHGAGHEAGLRAGTESALLTAALGKACETIPTSKELDRIRGLRDRLWDGITNSFGDEAVLNGHPTQRLPNTLNVGFKGLTGPDVLAALPSLAASTGSACHEGVVEISPVLAAMGVPADVAAGTVRFSLGRDTTEAEIDTLLAQLRATRAAGTAA